MNWWTRLATMLTTVIRELVRLVEVDAVAGDIDVCEKQ